MAEFGPDSGGRVKVNTKYWVVQNNTSLSNLFVWDYFSIL